MVSLEVCVVQFGRKYGMTDFDFDFSVLPLNQIKIIHRTLLVSIFNKQYLLLIAQ